MEMPVEAVWTWMGHARMISPRIPTTCNEMQPEPPATRVVLSLTPGTYWYLDVPHETQDALGLRVLSVLDDAWIWNGVFAIFVRHQWRVTLQR